MKRLSLFRRSGASQGSDGPAERPRYGDYAGYTGYDASTKYTPYTLDSGYVGYHGFYAIIDTEYLDWDRWVHVVPRDPDTHDEWRDIGAWCRQEASDLWEDSGLDPGPGGVAYTATMLERCAEVFCPVGSNNDLFLRMTHPADTPLPVLGVVRPSFGPREETLRALTLADDPEAVEPPVTASFTSPHLGEGLTTFRYIPQEDGANDLFACVRYAWQLTEPPAEMVLWTATDDTAQLLDAVEDIEELARTLRVYDP
ncbi:hypothetical protein ACFWMQ_06190 [Streptomyces sp. NPDC058372]|uniref:hypothetical protein n=1 Tax=unclassified Streptomyces TaxID=2593676 RepID=UPI0036558195